MKRIQVFLILAFCALASQALGQAAQLIPGEQCFQATTGINGMVGLLGTITGGTGGTTGTYGGVPLTGGSGSGATANITVSGGTVTGVAILNPGTQYVVADVLSAASANIGNVTGFSVSVSSVAINSSLAGGTVSYYIPSTNTFKQTWQNALQTVLNTNPVNLDSNGCAIVYGTGTYRQILKDSLGNTVWDQLTTAISTGNPPYWANLAGGTANAITVTDTGFAAQDGAQINFIALLTNTGAATLNPSGYGNIPIVKDTTAGPVALTGGEIVARNLIQLQYSATNNNFTLLNPPIQSAAGATPAPLCGAQMLVLTNGTVPAADINVTAATLVMVSSTGLVINRSNVSLVLNIATGSASSIANGMDGEAPGTNAWIDVFGIDNGAAPATLGSLAAGNGLSPQLPTGYTYICYLGAARVDGSGNLLTWTQRGRESQYLVGSANVPIAPNIANGVAGTWSVTSPALASVAVAAFVPPTATQIKVLAAVRWKGAAGDGSGLLVAPNVNWGGTNNGPQGSAGQIWPISFDDSIYNNLNISAWLLLEATQTIGWASNRASGAISALGWTDAVNAN
jgi:hypothetical protein